MTYPKWPSSVDFRALRTAWGGTPFRPPMATEMEDGNTRLRAQPGSNVGTYSWANVFNASEMAAFMTFAEVDLVRGAGRFRMKVSRDGITYEERVVQMVPGSLKLAAAGGPNTMVQFDLLVLPASYLPPAAAVTVGPVYITVTGQPGAPFEVTIT